MLAILNKQQEFFFCIIDSDCFQIICAPYTFLSLYTCTQDICSIVKAKSKPCYFTLVLFAQAKSCQNKHQNMITVPFTAAQVFAWIIVNFSCTTADQFFCVTCSRNIECGFPATHHYYSVSECAMYMLSNICPLTVEPDKNVQEKAFKPINSVLNKLRNN